MKYIRLILLTLILPVALISALIALLSYADVTLPLESARQQFITKSSELTGTEVRIDGEVRLAISFFPTLVVDQLHIANKGEWQAEDILSIEKTRVQIALLPLLSGQLEFLEISASAIRINLQQDKDDRQNWQSFLPSKNVTAEQGKSSERTIKHKKKIWVEEFRLSDLTLNYTDDSLGQTFTNQVDMLVVNTHEKNHLTATIQGTSKNIPYSFTAQSNLLRNLVENKPWRLDMQGQVSEKPLNLSIDIKHTSPSLAGTVSINVEDFDIGKTLSWLRLVDDLKAFSQSFSFTADLKGTSLKSILEESTFSLELDDSSVVLHDTAGNESIDIHYTTALIVSQPGKPLKLDSSGTVNNEAIRTELTTNKLSDFFSGLDMVNLDLTSRIAKSFIRLSGVLDLPVSKNTFMAEINIKGKTLNHWNGLLNSSIPPFGPYELKGKIKLDPQGIRISNAALNIGSSDLGGSIAINTSGDRTSWDMDLVSRSFQINDFRVEGITLFPAIDKSRNTPSNKAASEPLNRSKQKVRSNDMNAYPNTRADIRIESKRVLSGKDELGSGKLHIKLTENSIEIDRFKLNIPGGSVAGALTLQQIEDGVEGQLKLNMDKLDYGILYRFLSPDSAFDGLLSTRVNLSLKGDSAGHLMKHANGEIDFTIWPREMGADVLNIWSVNLFLALLPELNKKNSKLNCSTALLDIKDGQLNEELLFIDTSKIWMKGNVDVSFPEEKVSVTLFPTAKKARLFGLQVPIRLKGTFKDIGVAVKPFDLVTAYFSFITSPLHAPFRRAFGKKAGEDLSEFCDQLLDRDFLKALIENINERSPDIDEMYE